jgi:hypothetical protein
MAGIEPTLMIGVAAVSAGAIWKYISDLIRHRGDKIRIKVGGVEITVEGALSKEQRTEIVRNVTESIDRKAP